VFVDASALTAIIAIEKDALELTARIGAGTVRITSALAVWETATAIARIRQITPLQAHRLVLEFLGGADIELVSVPPEAAALALDAFNRFGKGRHKAGLNFGDCFAYACARHFRQPLMFKGSDFALTDIEAA
jgi:ribonuclease VapC